MHRSKWYLCLLLLSPLAVLSVWAGQSDFRSAFLPQVLGLKSMRIADIDAVDGTGRTLLHRIVASSGYQPAELDRVLYLLKHGASVHVLDGNGLTPLHDAVRQKEGAHELVKVLLKAGANVNALDGHRNTPLHYAIYAGYIFPHRWPFLLCVIHELLQANANANAPTTSSRATSFRELPSKHELNWRSRRYPGWCSLFQLAQGVHINPEEVTSTALHWAVVVGQSELITMLLDTGARPNQFDSLGNTPLHLAAMNGNWRVVQCLLRGGAQPDVRRNTGWTPLHEAATHGHVDVLDQLLRAGADPDACTNLDRSALALMVFGINGSKLHPDVVMRLLAAGATTSIRGDAGQHLLLKAAEQKQVSLVRSLLSHCHTFLPDQPDRAALPREVQDLIKENEHLLKQWAYGAEQELQMTMQRVSGRPSADVARLIRAFATDAEPERPPTVLVCNTHKMRRCFAGLLRFLGWQ